MNTSTHTSNVIVRDHASTDGAELGGKAQALAALGAAGFPVPAWLVLTPESLERSLPVRAGSPNCATFDELEIAPELEAELLDALADLAPEPRRFAVRSSARGEDSSEQSFAGQLESYLFVKREDVARRVVDVWRSGFSERVLAYRQEHGLDGTPPVPSVLIQVMIDADTSGVAFSADPVTGDADVAVVGSVYGLGTALVSGDVDADTHRIHRDGHFVSKELAQKFCAHRFSPIFRAGVAPAEVSAADASAWALSDAQAREVAGLARRAEEFFGAPQDIEWAIAEGNLFLLQSRPITTGLDHAPGADALNIWDNSNIAESYHGVTTPLTFSFARNAYRGVYTQLCHIFRMPESRIEDLRPALGSMIGLIRGRVYYNVLNWYRLLRQCPAYRVNAAFFEQMIGLKDSVPDSAFGQDAATQGGSRFEDMLRVVRTSLSIVGSYLTLDRRVRRFHARVETALTGRPDLATLSADQLVAEYRTLESRLITRWDAPLVNDFFAMIFYGSLHKCCVRWCGDRAGTLQNDLLCSSGGIVSTEPVRRMERMADVARGDTEFCRVLSSGTSTEIFAAMESREPFRLDFDSYLDKFGERCSEELKLESSTLHDDPLALFRAVGAMAAQARLTTEAAESSPLERAQARVRDALYRNPLKRIAFRWVAENARRTIRNRENLRLERTRVFGRVRRIFLELGKRLAEAAVLQDSRDVFYLQVDEVIAFIEGTAATTDLAGLAAARHAEFSRYRNEPAPPERFETRGPVYLDPAWRSSSVEDAGNDELRTGTGCCPGVVTGRVRVVKDPRTTTIESGTILVAERTDPGWIMLFPLAAGLLVQYGNLLSHSAIVSREMGIPSIVAVGGVTTWLRDGDTVTLDGANGVVRRVARAGERS